MKKLPGSLSCMLPVPFLASYRAVPVPFPALVPVPFLLLSYISWMGACNEQ